MRVSPRDRASSGGTINAYQGNERSDLASDRPTGTNRFGLLLLLLVSTYLLAAFTSGAWVVAVQVAMFAVVAVLGARITSVLRPEARLMVIGLLGGSAVMLALAVVNEAGRGVANIWIALVLLFTAVVIVRRILIASTVTLVSIYGAVSAYLLLGLMFAAIFAAIDHLGGGHFFVDGQASNAKTFQYFSFTTLTTLGYGDFTAAGDSGRAIAVLEALTGQIFLATLIARLVSAFRGPNNQQNQPISRAPSAGQPDPGWRDSSGASSSSRSDESS